MILDHTKNIVLFFQLFFRVKGARVNVFQFFLVTLTQKYGQKKGITDVILYGHEERPCQNSFSKSSSTTVQKWFRRKRNECRKMTILATCVQNRQSTSFDAISVAAAMRCARYVAAVG